MNQVILTGNVNIFNGTSVDLKTSANGTEYCNFQVSTRQPFKNKEGKYGYENIDCKAFGKSATFICQYFKKGTPIEVIGAIRKEKWTDTDGNNKYAQVVIVNNVSFCPSEWVDKNHSVDTDDNALLEEVQADADLPF